MAKIEGPDQPRSWIIAMAACVINTMLSGISRATGIFYVALIETYGITRMEANLPFTLRNCVRNLAGPIVGMIGHRYGVRAVTIIGGAFATVGIALCSIAPSIIWISVFWGGFHGLGVALANTLFQVTLNQYFLKYRATAAGIALSGACLGAFIFPIAIESLINTYGLSGSFILTSGLIMQVLPAAILLKEPPWLKKQMKVQEKLAQNSDYREKHVSKKDEKLCVTSDSFSSKDKSRSTSKHEDTAKKNNIADSTEIPSQKYLAVNSKLSETKVPCSIRNGKSSLMNGVENPSFKNSSVSVSDSPKQQNREQTLELDRIRTFSVSEVSLSIPCEPEETSKSIRKSFISVWTNPMFHLISFSLATFGTLYDPLVTVIVDYIKDKGLDDNMGKYLISILAFGDLIGRMCFGWVTDKNYLSLPRFMLLSHLIQGSCFLMLPLFYDFEALVGVIIVYGVSAGMVIIMFPILVAKYLASEQSLAIGCINFFGGLVAFAVPVLIGHFRDNVGSYDGMFYITGGTSIITGLCWVLEPALLNLRCKKTQTQTSSSRPNTT